MSSRCIRLNTLVTTLGAILVVTALSACGSDNKNSGTTGATGTGDTTMGLQAVQNRDCMTCHGTNLAGKTTPQPHTMAYPANLTPDMDTGIGSWSADTIVNAVLNGKDDENATLCSPMPKFSALGMTAAEATNVAAYLKSVAAVQQEIPESMCSEKGGD
jgi:mono/diheme cytochrome c family protein